jgi:hypothetical protein
MVLRRRYQEILCTAATEEIIGQLRKFILMVEMCM